MHSFARSLFALVSSALVVLACSSESKLGEACDESGADGECEAGGVCGKNSGGALLCLKVCSDQAQCAATEDCNGVDGTNVKGCRPKDATSGKK